MKRMECLDGLRGVLAVYVMVSHMAPFLAVPAWTVQPLSHGMAAVDVFFVLSGMVIVLSLGGSGYRVRPFLAARALRIFPVFLAVFLLAVATQPIGIRRDAMPWIAPDSLARHIWSDGWPPDWAGNLAAHLTMTHGLFPDGVWPHVYLGFLGSSWSLSTEWQFYLLAALFARPGREWRLVWGLLALASAAAIWTAVAPEFWQFSRAFLPNKAHFFALGIASAALLRFGQPAPGEPARKRRSGTRPIRPEMIRFCAVLAAVLAICLPGGPGKLAAPLVWTLCLAAQTTASRALWPLAALLRTPPLLWLGAISYCLYLVNEPVQRLLALALTHLAEADGAWFSAFWLPFSILLPIAAAWGLHRAIEQPALRWGRPRLGRHAADLPDAALNSPPRHAISPGV